MRSWTETARVEHHWVLTSTERSAVLAALSDVVEDPNTSETTSELLSGVITAAEAVVSGPA